MMPIIRIEPNRPLQERLIDGFAGVIEKECPYFRHPEQLAEAMTLMLATLLYRAGVRKDGIDDAADAVALALREALAHMIQAAR